MREGFDRLNRWIDQVQKVLVISHVLPDGDAIGSTLAMGYALKKLGKEVTMVNESPVPKKFHFLHGVGDILQPEQVNDTFDHVIVLDCADRSRMGSAQMLIKENAFVVNIDHHATNDKYGDLNLIDPAYAATAEILFDWIQQSPVSWDQVLATYVYTGILTDTGGFRYSNTTSSLLKKAARLIDAGVQAHEVADAALESVTLEQLRLLQMALGHLKRSEDGLIAWMSISYEEIKQFQATEEDISGLVNYTRNIIGVDVGVFFKEVNDGEIRVSLRSRLQTDVSKVAKHFGGGGHARAAGCTFYGTLDEAEQQIISYIQSKLKGEA